MDLGSLLGEVNGWPTELRPSLTRLLRLIATDVRFGHPKGAQPDPSLNLGGGFFHGTTPGTPGDELAIAHGFGRVPYLAVPVLRLDAVGSSVVPLTVSRVADDRRLYVTSTIADAPFSLFVEG